MSKISAEGRSPMGASLPKKQLIMRWQTGSDLLTPWGTAHDPVSPRKV